VILTALGLEYKAVSEHLQDIQEITYQGTIYGYGTFISQNHIWHVAVAEIGMGGPTAAAETERALSNFQPQITLFVGIGGGLKDVKLGDVVAASKIYAYESGKVEQQFLPRPEVWRASHALEQRARTEARSDQWLTFLGSSRSDFIPQVHIGALAAGEKVLASTQSNLFQLLKTTYGDTLAVEMEGHGFLAAVHANHSVHALVIRGISDLIDGKSVSGATGSQIVAARHAAAFAFQILAKFTPPPPNNALSSSEHLGVWNIPYSRNPHFTGRDDLLDQLRQQLTPTRQSDSATTRIGAPTRPLAIKGLGGIGKTQIAVEYAYRYRQDYRVVLWARADTHEALVSDYVGIAKLLNLPQKDDQDQTLVIQAVLQWFETHTQWLLIFDNADNLSLVHMYIPRQDNGSIIITTRAHAVGKFGSIEVEKMGLKEGREFLLNRTKRLEHVLDEEKKKATDIVIALDSLPLALDQAGAYVEETECSFNNYLLIYQARRKELLARRGSNQITEEHPDSVATTFSLSFQKVELANPSAAELLRLSAFLAPDKIPEELIRDCANLWSSSLQQAAADPFAFNGMMEELLKYSLVKRLLGNEEAFTIHRLVQAVQIDTMEKDKQCKWAERVIQAVNKIFPDNPEDVAVWSQCLRYLDQVQACNTLIEQYTLPLLEAADLLNRTGLYLKIQASYTMAEPLFKRALTIWEQQVGSEHPDVAVALNGLAILYFEQGKHAEAEPLFKRALAIWEQQFGSEHPDVAVALNGLASLYSMQGKYKEAELLFKRAQRIMKSIPVRRDVTYSLNNLATLYQKQGKYAEAEPLFKRALAIREEMFGPGHPDVATSFNNLAILYQQQGKYAEAEPLLKRALAIREEIFGPGHPDVASSLNGLVL
jgi:nucleoside phosphorylase/tetratricopeptide (TPR) repeat protein